MTTPKAPEGYVAIRLFDDALADVAQLREDVAGKHDLIERLLRERQEANEARARMLAEVRSTLDDVLGAVNVRYTHHAFADAAGISMGYPVSVADPRPPAHVDELWERIVSLEREHAAVTAVAQFARQRLA